jgi:hypothetical protein
LVAIAARHGRARLFLGYDFPSFFGAEAVGWFRVTHNPAVILWRSSRPCAISNATWSRGCTKMSAVTAQFGNKTRDGCSLALSGRIAANKPCGSCVTVGGRMWDRTTSRVKKKLCG